MSSLSNSFPCSRRHARTLELEEERERRTKKKKKTLKEIATIQSSADASNSDRVAVWPSPEACVQRNLLSDEAASRSSAAPPSGKR